MSDAERIESAIDRLVKLWPIGVLIFALVSGYLKLQLDVTDLKKSQEKWQASAASRRENTREEMESIRIRLTKLEAYNALSPLLQRGH